MKKDEPKKSFKIISLLVVLSMFCNLLPAQEIITLIQNSEAKLEYYLDRAMQERQNEKWETLVEEGLLSAMQNWENENIEKLDAADYESEKEKVENYFEKKISQAYTKWSLNKEKDNLDTQTGILEQRLKTAALAFEYTDSNGNKTRIVNINDSDEAKAQWQKEAAEIISEFEAQLEYDTSLMVSDIVNRNNNIDLNDEETQKIISEFVESQKKLVSEKYAEISQREGNSLLNVVLYDQESLRKASDKEAAMVIAKQLAKETEATTDLEMKNLFDQFEDEIIKGELENFDLQNSDWYSKFETALNESLEKWNEAELSFLQARSEWELNAEQVFTENEAVWQDAFKELDSRKQQWNEKIFNEIEALYVTLQTQRADLENEIATDLSNYYAMLENQRNSNNNLIRMQEAIYNQNRTLMAASSEGINNWFDHWGEKYNGLYSYWKTEDATLFNTYFGNTSQLTNTDLKINTNFTVDSDGNKIYSEPESLSITNLKDQLTRWNTAYIAMVKREISKEIINLNNSISYYESTYSTYSNEIRRFDSTSHSYELSGESYSSGERREAYESYLKEKEKIDYYRSQLSYLIDQKNKTIEKKNTLNGLLTTFNNTSANDDIEVLKSRINEINAFKEIKGITSSIFSGNYKALWNTDDFILGTSDSLAYWASELELSTRAVNEASVELYKKAGYTLTDSGMNELENQYLKSSALEQYWKEQLDIANAVKEYAENRTSTQEVLSETEKNLLDAIAEYNAANDSYNQTLDELKLKSDDSTNAAKKISDENEILTKQQTILEQKKNAYNAALDAYNGLYGSTVEKSINAIIDQLNVAQVEEAEKINQLNTYYQTLAKQVSVANERSRINIISGIENGIKNSDSEGVGIGLDYYAEAELDEYASLSVNTVINSNFDIAVFELKVSNICKTEVDTIKQALSLLNSDTTTENEKTQLKVIIEANLLNINKTFNKEKQRRALVKSYLNNEDIVQNVKTVTGQEMTVEFMKLYFELYKKAGVEEKFTVEAALRFDEITNKYKDLTSAEFYNFISENRDDSVVKAILNLENFSEEYIYLFNAKYSNRLFDIGVESEALVNQVKTNYSKYLVSEVNALNNETREKIASIISNNNPDSLDKNGILDYVTKLNFESDGLNDVGVSALNLYISELLYNFAYENEVTVSTDEINKKIANLTETLNEIINWTSKLQSAASIKEILKSDIFANLDSSSELRKQFISQAAMLFLPSVENALTLDIIKSSEIFDDVSDSIKNDIAKEILSLSKTYISYSTKITELDVIHYTMLETLTEKYFEKEDRLSKKRKEITVYENQLLNPESGLSGEAIDAINNKISDCKKELEQIENDFMNFVNGDEYYSDVYDRIDFKMTGEDWYLPLIVGRDFVYETLCINILDESGNINEETLCKIEIVNEYLENNSEVKIEELDHFVKILRYIQSYNELLDGNVYNWIESDSVEEEYKQELKDYYDYGWLIYPEYFSAEMQYLYSHGGDKYLKDLEECQNKLLDNVEELYNSNYKEYLNACYEVELAAYVSQKDSENFDNEKTWLVNKNNEIETENAKLAADKKVQKLNIQIDSIQKENNYSSAYAKYFTDSQTFDLSTITDTNVDYKTAVSEAYSEIYKERNTRKNSVNVLKDEFVLLEEMFEDSISKQEKVNSTFAEYQAQETIVNNQKQIYYDAINDYQECCKAYNRQMEVVQSAYNELEAKRIEKRKADEIKRWADNEYLHDYKGVYNSEEYITPQEKYDAVKEAYTKAKAALDYVVAVKESKISTVETQYETEYNEYTAAFEKYFRAILLKSEISQAIAKQEAVLKEAEEKVEKARIELIKSCSNKPELSDVAKKYVVAVKTGDNKYSFDITGYTSNVSQLDTYYNSEKSYLYTDENENDVYVDLAQADAFSWFLAMESKGGDQLEDLVLAASYLLSKDPDYQNYIANLESEGINDSNAAGLIRSLHGMDSRSIYNSAVSEEILSAYNKVMGSAEQRENLAKYLLYRDSYLVEENEQLVYRAHNVLCRRAYEHVKDSASYEESKNIAESVAMAIVAAGFYACVTIFTPWFLVPAIAATVAAACFAATAYDFTCYINELSSAQSSNNNNISARENKVSNLIKDYNDAEANRVAQRERLNLMKFGSTTGKQDVLSYDSFAAAVNESLKDTELVMADGTRLLSDDYLKEIYDINDKNSKSLESYYDVINENGTEITTVSGVLDKLVSSLNNVQSDKEVALNEKTALLKLNQKNAADKYNTAVSEMISEKATYTEKQLKEMAAEAWGNDSWDEIAYQNRMQQFYSQYVDIKYISNKRSTENYILDVISKLQTSYNLELRAEQNFCTDVREYKDLLVYQNYENEADQIEQQIEQIMKVSDTEWLKAEAKLNASHNTWLSEFDSQLKEKRNAWDTNYANFLTEKAEWITTQYVYANNVNSIESLANSGMDISKALTESLTGLSEVNVNNEALNSIKSDLNGYVSSLYSENLLTNLFDMASTAKTSKQSSSNRLLTANSMNLSTMESYFAAIKVQESITDKLKDNAARLAAEQAETQIAKMIEAYMSRIDSENESMRNWEETLVRSVGYEFGSTIKRDAIVDSTFFHTERETQYVHVYQDYVTTIPTVPLTISSNDTSSSIMTKIRNAQSILDQWSERIFGRTDVDENGNKTMKYFYVPRDVAELNNISEYEKNTIKQEDIGDRTDIVSIRDGEFGQHLGFEPEWIESKDIDVSKGREANLKSKDIHGEIGLIMLDFQWNEIVRNNGMALFSLPVYDKKLWPDGGIFEAPTLRGICSVACDIAGTLTGQSWWLGLVDDALFATLDLGIEKKDPGQVALGFAKAAAVNSLGAGLGAAGSALSTAASGITNTALRIGTNVLIGAGTSYLTSAGAGFINAINYDPENGWSYDIDSAVDNLHSASTIGGAVGAGVVYGLNSYFCADGTGYALNGKVFDADNIRKLTGLAGGLATNITSLAMGGDATFNLLSLVNSKTGAISGMLEFSFGQDGAKMRFGTGGMNISMSNLKMAATGLREAQKVNDAKNGGDESLAKLNAVNALGYADTATSIDIAKKIWNEQLGVEFAEMNNAYGNYVKGDDKITVNSNLIGKSREDAAKLAAVFAHEGGHYEGIDIEALAHALSLQTYMKICENMDLKGDNDFANEINDNILDERNWAENSGDLEWWLYRLDGTIVDTGSIIKVKDADGNDIWVNEDYRQVIDQNGLMIDFRDGKLVMVDEDGKVVRNANSDDKEYARVKYFGKDAAGKDKTYYSRYGGSRSVGLLREIGEENVKAMIGYEIDSCYDVPLDVLESATGISAASLEYYLYHGPSDIPGLIFNIYREEIIAEGMLNKLDSHWQKDKGLWSESSKLKIPGLGENEELGVSMIEDLNGNREYTFFTAGFEMNRHDNAYDVWKDGVEYKDSTYTGEDGKQHAPTTEMKHDVYANTDVSVWMRNLFTGVTLNYTSPVAWESVADHSHDTSTVTVNGHTYKGNTVVSENYKMHMLKGGENYGMTTVGVITDATTLSGKTIRKDGNLKGQTGDRWLFHSMCAISGGSAGCQGATSDIGTATGKWNDPNYEGSGADYMMQLWDKLKNEWNIYNGYEFNVHLTGQVRPN